MIIFSRLTKSILASIAVLVLLASTARAQSILPVPDETNHGSLEALLAEQSGTVWFTSENGSRYEQAGYWRYYPSYGFIGFQLVDGRVVWIDLMNPVEPGCLDHGTATYGWVMTDGTAENIQLAEGTIAFQSYSVSWDDTEVWTSTSTVWGSACGTGQCLPSRPITVDAVMSTYQDGVHYESRLQFIGGNSGF